MAGTGHGSTWCLRIFLAVYAWKSSFPSARILTLGSIPEHEQPPATLADLASRNVQNPAAPACRNPTSATIMAPLSLFQSLDASLSSGPEQARGWTEE